MRVLFVSKPICLPLHDGSQCLVRDIATHLEQAEPSVMGVRGAAYPFDPGLREVQVVPVYPGRGSFAPSTLHNARAFMHLLTDFRADLWHFVFAPSPKTTSILKQLRRVRRTKTLQTIASPPKRFEQARQLLFGDRVVVQSEWTKRELQRHAPEVEMSVIHPTAPRVVLPTNDAIESLRKLLELESETEVIVYPGDLEFSSGSRCFAELIETLGPSRPNAVFVFACRAKTEAAAGVERALKARLSGHRVRFTGELPSLLPLLALSHLIVFPTDSAFGKVDIPIALLEAMRLGVPVLSFAFGPLVELDGTVTVPVGDMVALVRETRSVLDDAARRNEISEAQRRFLEVKMAPETAARKYEVLYSELMH